MARPRLGQAVAGVIALAGLQLLLMQPASGAERSVPVDVHAVATPNSFTLSGTTIAFGNIALGSSVDSTDGTAAASATSTNNSITITNTSGSGPSGRITSITLDYTDATPGANCGGGQGDWVPHDVSVAADQFVLWGDLLNDLSLRVVVPANGSAVNLDKGGNWNNNQTRDLDLQLFMPSSVTTGASACTINITITTVP